MIRPFAWTLRGYCSVIRWPNFNIVVSHRAGRPEERGTDGGRASWWSSQTHIYQVRSFIWVRFVMFQTNTRVISKIAAHRSPGQMWQWWKCLQYWKIYQNTTERHKVSKCHWKNGTTRLAQYRAATHLQFIKIIKPSKYSKVKCNKMRYAYVLHSAWKCFSFISIAPQSHNSCSPKLLVYVCIHVVETSSELTIHIWFWREWNKLSMKRWLCMQILLVLILL